MVIITDLMLLITISILMLIALTKTKQNTDIVVDILSKKQSNSSMGFIPFNE